jgi:hypothetical protein
MTVQLECPWCQAQLAVELEPGATELGCPECLTVVDLAPERADVLADAA